MNNYVPGKMHAYNKKDLLDKIMEENGIPLSFKHLICDKIVQVCCPVRNPTSIIKYKSYN